MVEGAALPWGLPTSNVNVDPTLIKNVPESMKLDIGTARIEVKWILTPDDENDDGSYVTKWWPATISHLSEDGKTDGEGRLAFILRYDPDAGFGYEEPTEHTVTFLNEHELFDFGEVDLLQWRHAGTDWEGVPSWEDANPEIADDGAAIISMKTVLEKGERINKLTGTTLREDLANSMQDMPMEAQRIFADRVTTGLGVFGEELNNMLARNDGKVIEMEDVQKMLGKFKERTEGNGVHMD